MSGPSLFFLPRPQQQAQNPFVAGYYYTIIPSHMHCTKKRHPDSLLIRGKLRSRGCTAQKEPTTYNSLI